MKLEQQVASLELCKKLKELAVKQDSYFYHVGKEGIWDACMQSDYETSKTIPRNKWVSAFTVAELGEMLPFLGTVSWKSSSDGPWICREDRLTDDHTETADTEADSRAKMLIYLLENKLITL